METVEGASIIPIPIPFEIELALLRDETSGEHKSVMIATTPGTLGSDGTMFLLVASAAAADKMRNVPAKSMS